MFELIGKEKIKILHSIEIFYEFNANGLCTFRMCLKSFFKLADLTQLSSGARGFYISSNL